MFAKMVYNSRSVDSSGSVTEIFYKIAMQSGYVGDMDISFEKKHRSYIVLNTGSSPKWLSKRLPFGKWREISEILHDRYGLDFVLTGDSSEREYIEELSKHLVGKSENIAGKTDIQGLKKVLGEAFLTVSTDSASMHISASRKTPTIGIFGSTSWIRSAPFGPWSTVLYDRSLYIDGIPPASSLTETGNYYENIDITEGLNAIKDYL
jgi:ADP-heptose:LPS heptosyltransferase